MLVGTAGAHAYSQEDSRVRTSSPSLAALIGEANDGSPAFRGLVGAIDASDGLVYIESGRCGVNGIRACLAHRVTIAGPSRILHIFVDIRRADRALVGAIAHELQHAIEVLGNRTITTDRALMRFYLHRGARVNGVFETQAAIDAGQAVRDELARVRGK